VQCMTKINIYTHDPIINRIFFEIFAPCARLKQWHAESAFDTTPIPRNTLHTNIAPITSPRAKITILYVP